MTQSPSPLLESTTRALTAHAIEAQRASRTPALVAGVARHGELLWDAAVGQADLSDPGVPLGPDTQFLVASNTKTFTAVLIMQLRDEGKLSLDDTLDQLVPGTTHTQVTVREMLAHISGMQREPVGDVWDTLEFPDREGLISGWNEAERVLRPHNRWHYSNLCYALLGQVVARLDGGSWEASLQRRLLDPLELRRTTLTLTAPRVGLYYVPPFTDVPVEEPVLAKNTTDSAGALASTLADMVRWHGFLLDPVEEILSPDTVEEMRQPQIAADPGWNTAWGLGLELERRDGRIWFGHTGGMPGGITGFFSEPESGTTGAVLMNNSISKDPAGTAIKFGAYVVEHDPQLPAPWQPGTVEPEELKPLVGQWFSEGAEFTFAIADGKLTAKLAAAPATVPLSVFEPEGEDVYRTVSGRERGERLVIHRRDDGSVRQFNWATYRFTREPLGFGQPTP
ncbi:serine hydrolase domain-containing protein [Flexivirga oryzae]|uniref:CubicO group peptidase (Beta-lactamase class C family) n=1 Tax=Flexivirga oryzae TaxID=1794944 RepID=A0A839NBL6_9MICO|nr:serine hydrolase domain-containing protein [Flexivirga oryzae]MBB2893026.1 CubicO group peptidase (beta-lactamase class C family) [Flexivirga oryzae]